MSFSVSDTRYIGLFLTSIYIFDIYTPSTPMQIVVKPTKPENSYWSKYKERTERYYKKQNTDLDIKAMQFKLEQDKMNYKKDAALL